MNTINHTIVNNLIYLKCIFKNYNQRKYPLIVHEVASSESQSTNILELDSICFVIVIVII